MQSILILKFEILIQRGKQILSSNQFIMAETQLIFVFLFSCALPVTAVSPKLEKSGSLCGQTPLCGSNTVCSVDNGGPCNFYTLICILQFVIRRGYMPLPTQLQARSRQRSTRMPKRWGRPKNSRFLADFFLNGFGGSPPPLTENQCEKKKDFFLSGKGGYTPHP